MTNYQCFCTLEQITQDLENVAGLPGDVLGRFILPASAYLQREIGAFIPTLETLRFTGNPAATTKLKLPPLLRVTGSIVNDEDTLVSADYVLRANENSSAPAWPNGPYLRIDVDPDAENISTWCTELESISIPAAWGLYEATEATGTQLNGAQSSASVTSLTVDNGAKLSPGMVLKVEDELQFVSAYGAVTSAVTTLASGIDASQEEISLTDGTKVNIGEIIKVGFEKKKVLDISGNDVFVARGWDRTRKVTHDASANVDVYRTFTVARGCNGSTAAIHADDTLLYQYLVPEDVNYLARQIATLMMKKAQTGYAGRAGNSETGETFYTYEFPRDAIARVKANYRIPAGF